MELLATAQPHPGLPAARNPPARPCPRRTTPPPLPPARPRHSPAKVSTTACALTSAATGCATSFGKNRPKPWPAAAGIWWVRSYHPPSGHLLSLDTEATGLHEREAQLSRLTAWVLQAHKKTTAGSCACPAAPDIATRQRAAAHAALPAGAGTGALSKQRAAPPSAPLLAQCLGLLQHLTAPRDFAELLGHFDQFFSTCAKNASSSRPILGLSKPTAAKIPTNLRHRVVRYGTT